ncbi:unnamed protein product, partial [Mesorhabditis belari]|uniref:Uncharacterized protein n=1 Tax=Mesorhabditis belari TaxID=2138241 RepID=A0AAF3EKE2_9BILA
MFLSFRVITLRNTNDLVIPISGLMGVSGLGEALFCGGTHLIIVPLDLLKCRMQVDRRSHPSLSTVFRSPIMVLYVLGFSPSRCDRLSNVQQRLHRFPFEDSKCSIDRNVVSRREF